MNWYEQKTNEYESITGKQILGKFGTAGYGAYIILKQIIGQNLNDKETEWGFVSELETISSLAEKCGMPVAEFRLFLAFCDERFILEKKNGRLFMPSILEEKNNYIKKVERRKRTKSTSTDNAEKTKCTHSTYSTYTTDKSVQSDVTTQHNTTTTQIDLDKSKSAQKPDKRSKIVDHVLEEFKRVYSFYPTDKKPRFVAHNLIQRISRVTADRFGGELTDERVKKGVSMFFDWVADREELEGIQKLETVKLKINIFMEQLPQKGQK